MKKNKMMRIASFLLIATLLTTSIISGTFAKYVTSDSVADEARVAKFGVVVTADGSLFSTTYATDDSGTYSGDLSVVSSDDDKVVAPGTKNAEGLTISVTGAPEVAVKVEFTFGADDKDVFLGKANTLPDLTTGAEGDAFDNAADYYPIVYTLAKDGDEVVSGTLAEIKTYIGENYAGVYAPNTDLSETIGELTLTWEWAFENNVDDVDKKDTLLGDLAAGTALGYFWNFDGESRLPVAGQDYNLDVSLSLTVTVTQVD